MNSSEHSSSARLELLEAMLKDIKRSDDQFASLYRKGVPKVPILYFGNPSTATFATIGLNPSSDELTVKRWPEEHMSLVELDKRCAGYFHNNSVEAHKWFDGYERMANEPGPEMALNFLGHTYRDDTVHVDLSPRGTLSPSAARRMIKEDRMAFLSIFASMISRDLTWCLKALSIGGNIRAAIMSGAVTNEFYLNEFLQTHLPPEYSLSRRLVLTPNGRKSTVVYDLAGPSLDIPVLFVCRSPAKDKGALLAGEVCRH